MGGDIWGAGGRPSSGDSFFFFFFFFFFWNVCFRAWLNMGFCERREGGLGSVAGCGCDYCMMVVLVERSYSVQNFCTNPGRFSMVCYK